MHSFAEAQLLALVDTLESEEVRRHLGALGIDQAKLLQDAFRQAARLADGGDFVQARIEIIEACESAGAGVLLSMTGLRAAVPLPGQDKTKTAQSAPVRIPQKLLELANHLSEKHERRSKDPQ